MKQRLNTRNQVVRKNGQPPNHKSRILLPKDYCPICHVAFPTDRTKQFQYEHTDGTTVMFCYIHLMNITNKLGTYFAPLPCEYSPRFNLIKYLNETRKKIIKKPLRDARVQATLAGVVEILDLNGISKYIGGVAEFFQRGGLRVPKK